VEQFSEDLHRHLANLPVSAHEDSLRYRTEKFVRRNIIPVTAAAIAVLSLLVGLVVTTIAFRQARSDRALAESRFEDVRSLRTPLFSTFTMRFRILPGPRRRVP
jgi:eukaryotic-like serine/threonine-protein kinase